MASPADHGAAPIPGQLAHRPIAAAHAWHGTAWPALHGSCRGAPGATARLHAAPSFNPRPRTNPTHVLNHPTAQVLKITEDNNKLCKRLLEISSGAPKPASGPARPVAASMSPAGINRRRAEDRIAQENLAIYKRLQVRGVALGLGLGVCWKGCIECVHLRGQADGC